MNKQEEFQNRALANLLTERGVPADFEQRGGRKRMDVVADVDGLSVVLEAETGFHRKAQAIKDADARLRQGLTTAVFAVCYPTGITEDSLAEATLTWTLRTKPGEPTAEWSEGSLTQLTQAVLQAPSSLSGADIAAQWLSDGLDAAVQRLKTPVRQALAQALDLPATRDQDGEHNDRYLVAAKRGMLVVATAMLFHHRIQQHLLQIERPDSYDGEWPPASPTVCAERDGAISAFREAWRGILAVDYKPVFETGRIALTALSIDPDTSQALRSLGEVVARVSERVSGLRHDLLGRIFHRVLDTARYDGSFYTSTAAAVLLATLAVREQDGDWSDPNFIASLRICDPACGTGTLLMAAAERIRDLRNAAGQGDPEDEEALSLHIVEDVLWGYDINLSATHMAASTLAMLSPTTRFSRMHIFRALLGVEDGVAYLGSLDFLDGRPRLTGWPSAVQQVESGEGTTEPPPPMDLVIMNPPFTRDSLRHDQFSRADELLIKEREKEVLGDDVSAPWYEKLGRPVDPTRAAARLSGSANAFLVLADKMLHSREGKLAVVLPTVMATNPAAGETRKYLADKFHVDTIVSSHDPTRIFFSENTSIGEILLVCRRWNGDGPKPPTRFVNLARNPATAVEALNTASRIEQRELLPANFTVQHVESERIARGDWNAVNFLSPFLVESYRKLNETDSASVPTVQLSGLAEIGPAGQRIRDAYVHSEMPTPSGRRALWYHKSDITRSMRAEPDVYIEPKAADRERRIAETYWEQRSDLVLPQRLRLNVSRVASVMLPERVVGSIWMPCRPFDQDTARAICLYLNSTPGLLTLLGGRGNRVPSYPSFSLDTLRSLRVPNLAALGAAECGLLDGWFDWLGNDTLLPFPRMQEDPVRRQIDEAVSQALGLDSDWVATIRQELAREPSVTDRPYGG